MPAAIPAARQSPQPIGFLTTTCGGSIRIKPSGPSASKADGPWLTRAAAEWYWNAYLPDVNRRTEITASPALATVDQLRNLPDALIVVAENDPVRDEGEAYARNLADAGVRVTSLRYNGTVHDFVVLNALADTPAAASAVAQAVHALQSAFG